MFLFFSQFFAHFLSERPSPPINLLGDFAGGSMVAVVGILMALFERSVSGKGQVVDTSIVRLFLFFP